MDAQEHHAMVLDKTHPSGAEEWYCPTCGRRFLMQWPPAFSRLILQEGDENAIHSGGKGGLNLHQAGILPAAAPPLTQEEEETFQPWLDWFEQIDFDNLWNKDVE